MAHHPESFRLYLPSSADPLALIAVVLNNLPATDLGILYRVILRVFYESGPVLDGELAQVVTDLYLDNRNKIDPCCPAAGPLWP